MAQIKELLRNNTEEINKFLEEIMQIEDEAISNTLTSAMKYTTFSGGKRLRPILSKMVAEMVEGKVECAIKAGIAIELIHTYSLIHDDLPSMDNDDYRRGKLTNHKIFGPGIAILAGDALLTYAFKVLTTLSLPSSRVIKIIGLISDGAGYKGMVGGQVLDLEAEGKKIDLNSLKDIHQAKTGTMFKSAILAGGYCGFPSENEINHLKDFAYYLGLTFQIVDDILDVIGDEDKLGKKIGSDLALNKATYPRILGLEGAKKEAEKNAQLAREALKPFAGRADTILNLIDFILERQS